MKNHAYLGDYYMMGIVMNVQEIDGELVATMPGVPAGYEIQFEHIDGDKFRLRGGPIDGSRVEFSRNEDGQVMALQAGGFELAKVTPEKAATLPFVERLTAPGLFLAPEKQGAFQNLLDFIIENKNGGWIDYDLPYPRHEFVQYVMALDIFIFHGSNRQDIETFAPVRASVELYDKRGIGNLQAVYGTHDGLWAMFFAVVNRGQLRGSIRNGVMYFHNRAGEQLAMYNFSINQEQLAEKPWTEGALYFLPRDTFERQWLTDESYANEWASHEPVDPIARLHVDPADFPFLEKIGGHDDGLHLRARTLAETVQTVAVAASLEGARFAVTLPNSAEMAQVLDDFIEIQRMLMPACQFDVQESEAGLRMVIDALPPAFQQVFKNTYAELLDE